MIKARLQQRNDKAGAGHFNAARGNRTHNGIDLDCMPGSLIESPVHGKITKFGYPYADDLSWRYVEVTDCDHRRHRLFYVILSDGLEIGQSVCVGDVVGALQDIRERYPEEPDMHPHLHYEIKLEDDSYIDPEEFHK